MSAFGSKADTINFRGHRLHGAVRVLSGVARWRCGKPKTLLPAMNGAYDPSLAEGKRAQLTRLHFERHSMSAFGAKAEMPFCSANVRLWPKAASRLALPWCSDDLSSSLC